jgi:hypothetical protein
MRSHVLCLLAIALIVSTVPVGRLAAADRVPLYGVHEVVLEGPQCGPKDAPARDVELVTEWRHESGSPTQKIRGFWDGDGRGGRSGNVFKVRFCPTAEGKWTLVQTSSSDEKLDGQKEGYAVDCTGSSHPGFWVVDDQTGGRWYKRSDGSHPYIYGNTMYSFLSEYDRDEPTGGNIADDIRGNADYFAKVRFSIMGDRYPHPKVKPFLNDAGEPTDDGDFSHRPNPEWFHKRVDLAVQTAYDEDLIADLILCGPDTQDARSVLQAAENGGDPTPLLRYIAARYGSYPNVWICLCNEFNIKKPKYSTDEIARFGRTIRGYLPHPTPLSVHASPRNWYTDLNTNPPWHDHVIIQKKLKKLPQAADWIAQNHPRGGHVPVINDELAYEGAGDGWSEPDVIESHLGAFVGGGYGTTGHKPAGKRGHYFLGDFKASEHKAADNLKWLRDQINEDITFWKMDPVKDGDDGRLGIFRNVDSSFRAMAWPNREYVLGTNEARSDIVAQLPPGKWRITRYEVIEKREQVLSQDASGRFRFDAPDSRAVLFHFVRQ